MRIERIAAVVAVVVDVAAVETSHVKDTLIITLFGLQICSINFLNSTDLFRVYRDVHGRCLFELEIGFFFTF